MLRLPARSRGSAPRKVALTGFPIDSCRPLRQRRNAALPRALRYGFSAFAIAASATGAISA